MQTNSGESKEAVLSENKKKYSHTQKISISAMMLAIASLVGYFTGIDIPIAGINAVRISFHGSFLQFIAILFGPLFGGAIGAASDVINVYLKHYNFMPQFTVVAFLKGVSIGFLWLTMKKIKLPSRALSILISIAIPGIIFTTVNTWLIYELMYHGSKAFMVLWLPRIIEEILITAFNTYILLAMITVYEKAFKTNV